jgi:glycosyltransferase involved in cell wall biosynthesis
MRRVKTDMIYSDLDLRIKKSNMYEYLGNNKVINHIDPLITINVVTYQHIDYIEECLKGILMQETIFPYEIIIGEDESTDGTREICMQYAEKYPDKIRLFLRERKDVVYWNNIPTGSFNVLANIFAARGKYIAMCEGDDYWIDPYKLQKQIEFMENNPGCTMCTHAAIVIDSYGNKIKAKRPSIGNKIFSIENSLIQKKREATSSFLYLAKITSNPPKWFIEAHIKDAPLYLLCAYHGFVGYIDEFMSVYRRGVRDSWSFINENSLEFKISSNLSKLDIYDQFNAYSNRQYNSIIAKKKLHYIKKIVKLIKNNNALELTLLKNNLIKLPVKFRIYIYYLLVKDLFNMKYKNSR